jgi:hypothetical protein
MSQLIVFNQLKQTLSSIKGIKHVGLWNNQFERENQENAFLYPCCFIEFNNSGFRDLLQGVQHFDSTITIHLGFESYKDEDTFILQLKQDVYKAIHTLQCGISASKLLRVDERQNFDHANVQDYQTDYKTTIKDADASPFYLTATPTLTLTTTIA